MASNCACSEPTSRSTPWPRPHWRHLCTCRRQPNRTSPAIRWKLSGDLRRRVALAHTPGGGPSRRTGSLSGQRHGTQPHTQRRQPAGDARRRRANHRQHANVPVGTGRRPPRARRPRSLARVVLQRHRPVAARPQRIARRAGLRLRWRRRTGNRRRVHHRPGGKPAPHRHGGRQRILRSSIREEELSVSCLLQTAYLRPRSGTGAGPGLRPRSRRSHDRARRSHTRGPSRFRRAKP